MNCGLLGLVVIVLRRLANKELRGSRRRCFGSGLVPNLAVHHCHLDLGLVNFLRVPFKDVPVKDNHIGKFPQFEGSDFMVEMDLVRRTQSIGVNRLRNRKALIRGG
jgi:hypothetical protein